jgi:hypothetical protein
MGKVATNAEIRHAELMGVLPHCKTRKDAESVQAEIIELEDEMQNVCPECGAYESDYDPEDEDDFLGCRDTYHEGE